MKPHSRPELPSIGESQETGFFAQENAPNNVKAPVSDISRLPSTENLYRDICHLKVIAVVWCREVTKWNNKRSNVYKSRHLNSAS